MSLISDFFNFVAAQPCDREIDHSSFTVCAIGDFHRERLGEILPPGRYTKYEGEAKFIEGFSTEEGFIFECIKNASPPNHLIETFAINTYGGLNHLIQEFRDRDLGQEDFDAADYYE